MKTVLILASLLFSVIATKEEPPEIVSGKVVNVQDGDTFTLQVKIKKEKVRLYAVDAPELGQPWGTESKKALYNEIFGKVVKVEVRERDKSGTIIGLVRLGDRNLNTWMLREGNGWLYNQSSKDREKWGDLEKSARTAKKGLWAKAGPVSPSEWRKLHK